jgi:hypothetical protein
VASVLCFRCFQVLVEIGISVHQGLLW